VSKTPIRHQTYSIVTGQSTSSCLHVGKATLVI